jgi:hypothetical protein
MILTPLIETTPLYLYLHIHSGGEVNRHCCLYPSKPPFLEPRWRRNTTITDVVEDVKAASGTEIGGGGYSVVTVQP